jgi:Spy/CpxP family protein refolding chaperone
MLRIHTIALGLALCGGVAVAAGAQEAKAAPKSDTTTMSAPAKRHQMRSGRMDRGDRGLFKGIDLSSAQRARIDSIRQKYQAEFKPLRDEMMPAMKEARAARQSGDSAKVQAARQNMSASRDKMQALHKQEITEIRGVLPPEQQATFDKNATNIQKEMHERRGQRHGGRQGDKHSS